MVQVYFLVSFYGLIQMMMYLQQQWSKQRGNFELKEDKEYIIVIE